MPEKKHTSLHNKHLESQNHGIAPALEKQFFISGKLNNFDDITGRFNHWPKKSAEGRSLEDDHIRLAQHLSYPTS